MLRNFLMYVGLSLIFIFSFLQGANLNADEYHLEIAPLTPFPGWNGKISLEEKQVCEFKGIKETKGVFIEGENKWPITLYVEMEVEFPEDYGGEDKKAKILHMEYDSNHEVTCKEIMKEKECCYDFPANVRSCSREDIERNKLRTIAPGDKTLDYTQRRDYYDITRDDIKKGSGWANFFVNREKGTFHIDGSVYIYYEDIFKRTRDWWEVCSQKNKGHPLFEMNHYHEEPRVSNFYHLGTFDGGVIKGSKELDKWAGDPYQLAKQTCGSPYIYEKKCHYVKKLKWELYDCQYRVDKRLKERLDECYYSEDILDPNPCDIKSLTNCWQNNQDRSSCFIHCPFNADMAKTNIIKILDCIEDALKDWTEYLELCP